MRPGSHLNFGFMIILLLAIFVRGFVPVGFMPGGSKSVALTICSGLVTKTIFIQDKDSGSHQPSEDHQICPFFSPVLAGSSDPFDIGQYISVAYAKFHPHRNAPAALNLIAVKTFLSQGPPDYFSA